jgi:hypothetical protein
LVLAASTLGVVPIQCEHFCDGQAIDRGVNQSILSKSLIDAATKVRAILLLQIPATLGRMARTHLQQMSFDLRGFMEVWVASFREKAFEIFPPLTDEEIAVAAYYLSEKAGFPSGNDLHFWFAAIDQLQVVRADREHGCS